MKRQSPFWGAIFAAAFAVLAAGATYALELKENAGEIQQAVHVPGMQIAINPGGTGCVGREAWDPDDGGCSDSAYQKSTARVVQVQASAASVEIGSGNVVTLTAVVKSEDGKLVGAGIPVFWTTDLGALSETQSITGPDGTVAVSFSAPKGTRVNRAFIKVGAAGGGTQLYIEMISTAKVSALVANPPSVEADGITASNLLATVTYADGTRVGAGVRVSWRNSMGTLNTAYTETNANGQAAVSIYSETPGTATIEANSPAGSLFTNVDFLSGAPVINSFTWTNITSQENCIYVENGSLSSKSIFNWSAQDAVSYTLTWSSLADYKGGKYTVSGTVYRGTASSFLAAPQTRPGDEWVGWAHIDFNSTAIFRLSAANASGTITTEDIPVPICAGSSYPSG